MFQSLKPFFQEKHGQAVSFLPGGCGGRPEPQLLRVLPFFYQAGQQDGPDGIVVGGIAEEVGFVGGHGLDDLAADLRLAGCLQEQRTRSLMEPRPSCLTIGARRLSNR